MCTRVKYYNIIVYYCARVICVAAFTGTRKTERRAWGKKTIETSTGGGRTRTDRRSPYALAEQQRWSVVAVVTDSSVVVSSAAAAAASAAAAAAAQAGYVG